MKKRLWIGMTIMLFICYKAIYPIDLKLERQWKHNIDLGGDISHCLLDHDGDLILVHRPGISLVNENHYSHFASWGQGPNEIGNVFALCQYEDNIAVFEYKNKAKLFAKKDGQYAGKEVKNLKSSPSTYYLRDGYYSQNRFLLGGPVIFTIKNKILDGAMLKVYNDKSGETEKSIIPIKYQEPNHYNEIRTHFAEDEKYIYFMAQHEMKVFLISKISFDVEKTIEVKKPDFYVAMPKNYFGYNKDDKKFDLFKEYVKWQTTFSAVTRIAVIEGGFLVIQIRTCSADAEKFGLLFYNINNNFALEKVILMKDYLLAGRKNLLYFVHNGDPMEDEEANRLIIDVYRVVR